MESEAPDLGGARLRPATDDFGGDINFTTGSASAGDSRGHILDGCDSDPREATVGPLGSATSLTWDDEGPTPCMLLHLHLAKRDRRDRFPRHRVALSGWPHGCGGANALPFDVV